MTLRLASDGAGYLDWLDRLVVAINRRGYLLVVNDGPQLRAAFRDDITPEATADELIRWGSYVRRSPGVRRDADESGRVA